MFHNCWALVRLFFVLGGFVCRKKNAIASSTRDKTKRNEPSRTTTSHLDIFRGYYCTCPRTEQTIFLAQQIHTFRSLASRSIVGMIPAAAPSSPKTSSTPKSTTPSAKPSPASTTKATASSTPTPTATASAALLLLLLLKVKSRLVHPLVRHFQGPSKKF